MALYLCLGIESGCRGEAVRGIKWGNLQKIDEKALGQRGKSLSVKYIASFFESKNNKPVSLPVSDFCVGLWCDYKVCCMLHRRKKKLNGGN